MKYSILTIGRQSGSGGREIGERLAKALEIPCYDKLLVEMAAEKSGLEPGLLEQYDERTVNRFFYSIPSTPNKATGYGLPIVDTLFKVQSQSIQELAQQGPCIFVGRCADYVLREREDVFSIFLYAPLEDRVRRIMARHQLDAGEAEQFIKKADKNRRRYYNYYTHKRWGQAESYRLCLDTSLLGLDGTAKRLLEEIRREA